MNQRTEDRQQEENTSLQIEGQRTDDKKRRQRQIEGQRIFARVTVYRKY